MYRGEPSQWRLSGTAKVALTALSFMGAVAVYNSRGGMDELQSSAPRQGSMLATKAKAEKVEPIF